MNLNIFLPCRRTEASDIEDAIFYYEVAIKALKSLEDIRPLSDQETDYIVNSENRIAELRKEKEEQDYAEYRDQIFWEKKQLGIA